MARLRHILDGFSSRLQGDKINQHVFGDVKLLREVADPVYATIQAGNWNGQKKTRT
jgi:hypothetical protein